MNHGATTIERTTTASDSITIVKEVYDAFSRGDVQRIFALFHSEGVITQSSKLPWGGRYEGHDGLGTFLTALTGTIESAVATERYIDDGDGHVVASGFTRGRVRTTGRSFDVAETHVWTIRDGKVMRFDAYIDTAAMLEALGL